MGRDRIAGPALYSCMACCCGVSTPALTQHAHRAAAAAAQTAHSCQIAAGQGVCSANCTGGQCGSHADGRLLVRRAWSQAGTNTWLLCVPFTSAGNQAPALLVLQDMTLDCFVDACKHGLRLLLRVAASVHHHLPLHGCLGQWLGLRCHPLHRVLHQQGRPCDVQLLGRRGVFCLPAGAACREELALPPCAPSVLGAAKFAMWTLQHI